MCRKAFARRLALQQPCCAWAWHQYSYIRLYNLPADVALAGPRQPKGMQPEGAPAYNLNRVFAIPQFISSTPPLAIFMPVTAPSVCQSCGQVPEEHGPGQRSRALCGAPAPTPLWQASCRWDRHPTDAYRLEPRTRAWHGNRITGASSLGLPRRTNHFMPCMPTVKPRISDPSSKGVSTHRLDTGRLA